MADHLASMLYRSYILVCLDLLLASSLCGQEVDSVHILWWNVENAFDTVDAPLTYDEEFTPEGIKAWNSYRFYRKITVLAKGLRAAAGADIPDFIGLCEVESPAVMDALMHRLPWEWPLWQYYEEGPDARGIDIVVLYHSERWKLIEAGQIANEAVERSRSAVMTTFVRRETPLDTLVLSWWHLPSRRRSNPAYRQSSLASFAREGTSDLILGDMNSDPRGPLAGWMKALGYKHLPQTGPWGTYAFGQKWSHLDSVWRCLSSSWQGNYKAFGFGLSHGGPHYTSLKPTFYAGKYFGGASDHLPLRICIHK